MKKIYYSTVFILFSVASFAQEFELQPFASGFSNPVGIENADDDRL